MTAVMSNSILLLPSEKSSGLLFSEGYISSFICHLLLLIFKFLLVAYWDFGFCEWIANTQASRDPWEASDNYLGGSHQTG